MYVLLVSLVSNVRTNVTNVLMGNTVLNAIVTGPKACLVNETLGNVIATQAGLGIDANINARMGSTVKIAKSTVIADQGQVVIT